MKKPVFEGLATALVTPFRNGTVDISELEQLLDFQLSSGADAVVICGTTGEAAAMAVTEQLDAVGHAVSFVHGRCKVIAGTGSNNTAHAQELSKEAEKLGADAVLVVTPYYNKCTQAGLRQHYSKIANAVTCPVILYNVPGRTGVDISVESCKMLSRIENVCGIKEACGDIGKVSRILDECGSDLPVYCGNDAEAVAFMSLGAKGLISVLSNVLPLETKLMLSLCLRQHYREAAALQQSFSKLIEALFCEVNPIPVKKAMQLCGMEVGVPRLPLTELSPENTEKLRRILKALP